MIEIRPPGWSTARLTAALLIVPALFVGYAALAPTQDTRSNALGVATLAAFVVNVTLFVYFRLLRPWFGTLTGLGALSLIGGILAALAAALSPSCPSGSSRRCTTSEIAEAATAGFLVPVALLAVGAVPVLAYALVRRFVAWRRRRAKKSDTAASVPGAAQKSVDTDRVAPTSRTATPPRRSPSSMH